MGQLMHIPMSMAVVVRMTFWVVEVVHGKDRKVPHGWQPRGLSRDMMAEVEEGAEHHRWVVVEVAGNCRGLCEDLQDDGTGIDC